MSELADNEYVVAEGADLDDGDRVIVEIRGREVAVFQADGGVYAVVNFCPHQGGPVCEGSVGGTRDGTFDKENLEVNLKWHSDGKILSCPWHAWEFDIRTGDHLADDETALITYPAREEDGRIIVTLE